MAVAKNKTVSELEPPPAAVVVQAVSVTDDGSVDVTVPAGSVTITVEQAIVLRQQLDQALAGVVR